MQNTNQIHNDRMTTEEAAAYLQFKKSTLDVWRHLRKGPKYLKTGFRVYYRKVDLDNWLASCVVCPGNGR